MPCQGIDICPTDLPFDGLLVSIFDHVATERNDDHGCGIKRHKDWRDLTFLTVVLQYLWWGLTKNPKQPWRSTTTSSLQIKQKNPTPEISQQVRGSDCWNPIHNLPGSIKDYFGADFIISMYSSPHSLSLSRPQATDDGTKPNLQVLKRKKIRKSLTEVNTKRIQTVASWLLFPHSRAGTSSCICIQTIWKKIKNCLFLFLPLKIESWKK